MENEIIKLIGIKTKNGFYVSDNVLGQSSWNYNTKIDKYRFDGLLGIPGFVKDWVLISNIPQIIEELIPERHVNCHLELKDGFPISDKTPKIIEKSYIDDESEFYGVSSLYESKYEIESSYFQSIKFELNIIDSLDDFKPIIVQYPIENTLLDRITTHPILLPSKPCKLSIEQTYKIIRTFIKTNINPDWAKVTSDYDFCFTVKKIVTLDEPASYVVDIANINNWGRRQRKSKMETRYRKSREIEIFEMAPKPYQSYTVVDPFEGKTYDDMVKNINDYLSNLINKINEPLNDCPHCHGLGVVTV